MNDGKLPGRVHRSAYWMTLLSVLIGLCIVLNSDYAEAKDDTLRLGVVPVEVGALAYYAYDEGFFKKAGLDVELVSLAKIT